MYQVDPQYIAFANRVKDFVKTSVAPNIVETDIAGGVVRSWLTGLGKAGFLKAPFPASCGGNDMDYRAVVILIEEVSKVSGSLGACLAAHMQCAYTFYKYGTPQQKEKYFLPAINGEILLSFAVTEESSGSDMLDLATTAEKTDAGWSASGAKRWVSNGGEADVYVFSAKTASRQSRRDVSMFIIERGTPGFTSVGVEHLMGMRNLSVGRLTFESCLLPLENLLGNENHGYTISHSAFDDSRLFLAAAALGLAKGACKKALLYVKAREQYGRTITYYQGISFPLAQIHAEILAMSAMLHEMTEKMCQADFHSSDIASLKLFCTDKCCEICDKAQELMGGNGYSAEYELERYVRDSRLLRLAGGTSNICRLIISNSILYI